MKLSVHLVTWNGGTYIPYLFDSLRKQTYKDWRLVILDNGSSDNTVEEIKKEISKWKLVNSNFEIQFFEKKENLGFAGGHNFLFTNYQLPITNYFLLLNQDMYLMSDCFEKMVKCMDEHKYVASVSPRLMKWNFQILENTPSPPSVVEDNLVVSLLEEGRGGVGASFTDKIDALGLKVFRNRRVIEQYTGKEWNKLSNLSIFESFNFEVFGVSGALPMYRTSAIKAIQFNDGTFLDESYHSYKEDVDLAFRLQSAGFKSYILLDTVAYHDRSAAGPEEMGDKAAIENKQKQSPWVKYHSYKNHLMTLYKNEYWQNLLLDFPWILWYELKKFVWFLLFDRSVLKGVKEIVKNRKGLKNKRMNIKDLRKVGWRGTRRWWR